MRRSIDFRTAGAAALMLAACSAEEPTEIVAGISTQMRVPEGIKSVGLLVQAEGQILFCNHYPVVDGTATLPGTLGVLGETRFRRSPGDLVTVQVLGFRTEASEFADNCLLRTTPDADSEEPNEVTVVRRRRLTFVRDRILFLPLPLKESCSDRTCSAEDGLTCVGGACVSMDIAAASLPDYQESLIFGDTSTCFDPDLCLADDARLPVLLEDPETCTFRATWPSEEPPPADELNVRMVYSTLGSEILDLDPSWLPPEQHEGLSLPDPSDPLQFRLAPNLCETNYKADRIIGIEASALCPAKRPFQPICDKGLTGADPAAGGGNDDPRAGTCTLAALAAAPSAAYVLMDRSRDMFEFFGDGGLRFAVELPLESPVARGTRMAFDLLPAAAPACDASPAENDFSTPQIAFDDVSAVRGPIGDLLGDAATVLADNPPLLMEAAMEGAYQALADLQPSNGGSRFNRKALVVIANRGFAGTCPTDGVTPAQRALTAFTNQGIYTYAVVLENESAPDSAAVEVAEATAVALGGGTEVFNGVADEAEGAAAVQEILNDLGSCLYEVRAPLIAAYQSLPAAARVSYYNPLPAVRDLVDIPHNAACNEQSGEEVSGWNQEGDGLVRICGAACNDLRDVLDRVAGVHALEGRVAPSVPLIVSGACPADDVFVQ